jgi:excisionase family DNA binding protein
MFAITSPLPERTNQKTIEVCVGEHMSEAGKRFLTAEDAATYLGGLNSRTVTRWAREGYLPAYPIGEGKRRLWRFVQKDLEEWMVARRQGGQFPVAIQGTTGTLVRSHRCSGREKYD